MGLVMSADVGFDVRVYLLNSSLNESVESKLLGWTLKPHIFKNVGLYYKEKFVWSFEAEGKTPRELLREIMEYACVCMNFMEVLKE